MNKPRSRSRIANLSAECPARSQEKIQTFFKISMCRKATGKSGVCFQNTCGVAARHTDGPASLLEDGMPDTLTLLLTAICLGGDVLLLALLVMIVE